MFTFFFQPMFASHASLPSMRSWQRKSAFVLAVPCSFHRFSWQVVDLLGFERPVSHNLIALRGPDGSIYPTQPPRFCMIVLVVARRRDIMQMLKKRALSMKILQRLPVRRSCGGELGGSKMS